MSDRRSRAAVFPLLLALLPVLSLAPSGCGGSLNSQGNPDGGRDVHPTLAPCASLGACACYTQSDRCTMQTEPCWCPSECDPNIACVCGGGQFLGCQDKTPAGSCDAQLARVQSLCAGQSSFVGSLAAICSTNPTCMAGCLQQLGTVDSCAQIDCGFCTACDCLVPSPPSALRSCVNDCTLPAPPLR